MKTNTSETYFEKLAKQREAGRRSYYKHKEERLAKHKEWNETKDPKHEKRRAYHRTYWQRLRKQWIELLGSKCTRCGFDDWRALQVDHINGGGHTERNKWGKGTKAYYLNIIASVKAGENRYQLLCANCNWIKRHENGEQRH